MESEAPAVGEVERPVLTDVEADMAGAEMSQKDIDASFAQMSKRFHDEGGELYVPTAN